MTLYEAAKQVIRAQLEYVRIVQATENPLFDPYSDLARQQQNEAVLRDALTMSVNVLVRLDALDNPENDQAQAYARELAKLLGKSINFNFAKLGIPVDE